MNILTTLFTNLATFSKYAPGVETNMSLDDFQSSGFSAEKRIEAILSSDVFSAIVSSKDDVYLETVRSAMANMTLSIQLVFDAINRRKNKIDVYKYELEAMKRSYMDNYFNAMDSLINNLSTDTSSDVGKAWAESKYYTLISSCKIKSADDFDMIYPIDNSYLFFFRTVPLQKECLDERLDTYFDKTSEDKPFAMLKLALAKKTIAKSLRRFDILEFPPTIRNLFDDNTSSRSGKDESDRALTLADSLDAEAEELINNVDTLIDTSETTDVSSYSGYNNPDDKIILMP